MNEPSISFPLRLNRYLALKGYATRRAADDLIRAGKVLVNGLPGVIGQKLSAQDHVEIRSRDVASDRNDYRYALCYKPRGVVTHSPRPGEQGAARSVGRPDLFPVGRLDKESEGLLVLTDDGRITERLLHPRYQHEKEYDVTVREAVGPEVPGALLAGVRDGGEFLQAKEASRTGRHTLAITLTEGKKHQIRRMLATLNLTVERLVRVRIMDFRLGELRPGESRLLRAKEREQLLRDLGLPIPSGKRKPPVPAVEA
jgi:pseudouridine synthase